MSGSYRRVVFVTPLLLAAAGCQDHRTAQYRDMDHMDTSVQTHGAHFTNMIDNAILRDMSVADAHFIPHTAELSGIGEARLNRMAALLNTYGGTVRYETCETNDALVEARLANVGEYLQLTGCDMGRVKVRAMMPGGHGMPGDEAVKKYERGTAKSSEQSGGGPAGSLLAPSEGK